MQIASVTSRKILNSASDWTIQTTITLQDGSFGVASVPGGISRGKDEVANLSADEAVKRVGELEKNLLKRPFTSQKEFDEFLLNLDGTKDKSNLGGNTILSLSEAFCKATSKAKSLEVYECISQILTGSISKKFKVPQMMMLMLEGGLHGSGGASIQEFMAIVDSIGKGVEIYSLIHDELHKLKKSTNVGAEGAFSPNGYDNDQMLSLLSGFLHGEQIAIDVAASSFKDNMEIPHYDVLLKTYPIASIEDPYSEEDWTNWELFGQKYSDKIIVVTDDLTVTNPVLLKKAIDKDVGNAILVKPNQIGSITETLEVVKLAQDNGWQVVISHRGTDTNDDFIADLAVGVGADFIKFGAPARGERVAKYNRLLAIQDCTGI